MTYELVTISHNDYCPVATGEAIGEAYCACPYLDEQGKRLARLVLNLCECDGSRPDERCTADLAADIILNELPIYGEIKK